MTEQYSIVLLYHQILFIQSSVNGHLRCLHCLVVMNNAALQNYVQVVTWSFFSVLLGLYLEVQLLGQMAIPCSTS